jgi:hypothetical protein
LQTEGEGELIYICEFVIGNEGGGVEWGAIELEGIILLIRNFEGKIYETTIY